MIRAATPDAPIKSPRKYPTMATRNRIACYAMGFSFKLVTFLRIIVPIMPNTIPIRIESPLT
jgi:hypothetical protein